MPNTVSLIKGAPNSENGKKLMDYLLSGETEAKLAVSCAQMPLHPGVVEVITTQSSGVGGRHEYIWDVSYGLAQRGALHIGKIVAISWPGEHPSNPAPPLAATHLSPVRWMLLRDWLPFQRKTFNTPAFPGYVSGHSAFSRAAAEVLAAFTGSPWFPAGLHEHHVPAGTLQMDYGPSQNLTLQWATYADAADQAGQSRRWGGIHTAEDDYHGRVVGHAVGVPAYQLARSYWDGSILRAAPASTLALHGDTATLTARFPRAMFWKVQHSQDLHAWTDFTAPELSYHSHRSIEIPTLSGHSGFFRVAYSPQAPPTTIPVSPQLGFK
jgi:hypothetical protein